MNSPFPLIAIFWSVGITIFWICFALHAVDVFKQSVNAQRANAEALKKIHDLLANRESIRDKNENR